MPIRPNTKPFSSLLIIISNIPSRSTSYIFSVLSFSLLVTHSFPYPPFSTFPFGHSKFLWNSRLNMNEKKAMARAEIKISLFTALQFGNAISICTVWPRDIYCFGLSSLYCGVSFIPSSRLWCYHLLITSSSLRHSGQLHHFRGSNMWTWGWT